MQTSPTIGALCAALAKAKVDFSPAVKDGANPFFHSDYLTLAGAYKATTTGLSNNGLAVIQATSFTNDSLTLTTVLAHSSGEWISGAYPINPVKSDPQGIGSAITYARRYAFMAIVGLAPEDDDGNEANGREAQARQERESVQVPANRNLIPHGIQPTNTAPQVLRQPVAVSKERQEYDRLVDSIIKKVGAEEGNHQINAIKKSNGTNWVKTVAELKSLEASL